MSEQRSNRRHRSGDLLRLAGQIECRTCGDTSNAITAEWLNSHLIIATFPSPCEHERDWICIVNPAELAAQGHRCAGFRADGQPCRAHRMRGHRHCRAHLPEGV